MIKVSVIIPVFNAQKYLRDCLDSIIFQSLKDIEIICINDGSEDHSLELLNEYSQKHYNINVLVQKNYGRSIARNRGISQAKGEYIIFLDSDDLLESYALAYLWNIAKKNDLDVLYFDAKTIYEDDEKKKNILIFRHITREKKIILR